MTWTKPSGINFKTIAALHGLVQFAILLLTTGTVFIVFRFTVNPVMASCPFESFVNVVTVHEINQLHAMLQRALPKHYIVSFVL